MDDATPHVENEIQEHKNDLNHWISDINKLQIPKSRKGVSDRFIRDCKILIQDLDTKASPQVADLVDFTDRRNSLEIQYFNITSDNT